MHEVDEVHETPFRELAELLDGFGVAPIDQAVPFQDSASVERLPDATADPTAVHAVADVHETAFRALSDAPTGLGVVRVLHERPFQASARVTV
jgi:hypothetical protein